MTTFIACEKTQESIVETNQQAVIMLDIDNVSLESVKIRVRHGGDPDMLWSYMYTDDLQTPAQQLLEEQIAKDHELTGEIVVYVGQNKSVPLSGLQPKCSYRFICGSLDPISGKITGKVSEIQFKTRRDPAVFELNNNWTITVGDRIVNNIDKQEYDSFILDSNDEESYVLVPLKVSDFDFYYSNNMQAFFEDYVASYGYEVGDNKWRDIVKTGDMTWTEQRLRSGVWFIFMIGIDSEGELTGYYQKLELTIEQEVATDAYNRWLGTWQVYSKDGEALFQIDILPSENNMWFYMSGWESNNVYGYDTTDPALMPELFFDKETGEMCFISQYVNTMINANEAYDFYFSGTFTYGNTYVLGSEVINYRMADADFMDSTYKNVKVEPCDFVTQGLTFPIESICYMYSVSGQLGAISLAPPTLPLTMTKVK
jgi:hypothetical protein